MPKEIPPFEVLLQGAEDEQVAKQVIATYTEFERIFRPHLDEQLRNMNPDDVWGKVTELSAENPANPTRRQITAFGRHVIDTIMKAKRGERTTDPEDDKKTRIEQIVAFFNPHATIKDLAGILDAIEQVTPLTAEMR